MSYVRTLHFIPGLLILAACAGGTVEAPAPAAPESVAARAADLAGAEPRAAAVAEAEATITADVIRRHVEFLASDELRGRDTPSPELERAAAYLSEEFKSLGLRPFGDSGTFLQRWPYVASFVRTEDIVLRSAGEARAPRFGQDFFVVAPGQTSLEAEAIYAGVASSAGADGASRLRGRIVFYSVAGAAPDAAWQQQVGQAVMGSLGAAAVGLILDPEFSEEAVAMLADQLASAGNAPLPIVGIRRAAAERMLAGAGVSLNGGAPGVAGGRIEIRIPVDRSEARPPNVVAVLPGSDPELRDTYLIYSAHFDHVGVGSPDATGDSIFNGADDNASGTAAVLAAARAFSTLPTAPARSIIFLGVSGEEKGLLGSAYFADNPPVPVENIVANINLDMVGRNHPDTVVAIGQDYSSLGPLIQSIAAGNPELGLVVAPDLWPEERLFFRSDHFSFARNGIAAIFLTTGLHEEYHRQGDRPELLDADKNARIARLVFRLGEAIANDRTRPAWTEEGRAEVRALTGGR